MSTVLADGDCHIGKDSAARVVDAVVESPDRKRLEGLCPPACYNLTFAAK